MRTTVRAFVALFATLATALIAPQAQAGLQRDTPVIRTMMPADPSVWGYWDTAPTSSSTFMLGAPTPSGEIVIYLAYWNPGNEHINLTMEMRFREHGVICIDGQALRVMKDGMFPIFTPQGACASRAFVYFGGDWHSFATDAKRVEYLGTIDYYTPGGASVYTTDYYSSGGR